MKIITEQRKAIKAALFLSMAGTVSVTAFTPTSTSTASSSIFSSASSPSSLNASMNSNDLPTYSQSIPFLKRPKTLTQELAGDVGFDPLNFATNNDILIEYREAEIKHGRLAMLASAGWVFAELYDEDIASYIGMEPILNSNDRVPSVFNGGMERVSPLWWGFCLGLTAAIDLYGVKRARVLEDYTPGDLGFDPLGLYPDEEDEEGRLRMELAEIKHGRLGMIAITAFSVQEFVSKVGVVDETPWFFQPIIQTARPFLENVANN